MSEVRTPYQTAASESIRITYEALETVGKRKVRKFDVSGLVDEESGSLSISDRSGVVHVALDDLDELIMSLLCVRRELLDKWEQAKANITVEV